MEYIEKKGDIFYAKKGEVKIDNVIIFNSRRNVHGAQGSPLTFTINGYSIQWHSNFGYGSWSNSYVEIKYKGLEIRHYSNIDTTKGFVDILNKYVCIQEEEKEEIMIELANIITYCGNELFDKNEYTSISLDELKMTKGLFVYNKIKEMKVQIHELKEEIERLNTSK